jgi:hypothetical protein
MRFHEIDTLPKIGDILEIELGDQVVETVIRQIHGDSYICETNNHEAVSLLESITKMSKKTIPGMHKLSGDTYVDLYKFSKDVASADGKGTGNKSDQEVGHAPFAYAYTDSEKKMIKQADSKAKDISGPKSEEPNDKDINEAEYQGRKVPLGKRMQGDVKKFKVYVRDPSTGNVKKVNFGDPNMRIKKSNPKRRKSFRARHNCDTPGPRTKARYWSCRAW